MKFLSCTGRHRPVSYTHLEEERGQIREILKLVEYHTMTVELIAKYLREAEEEPYVLLEKMRMIEGITGPEEVSDVYKRQCAHCGRKLRKGDVDIDHILPRSKGGIDDPRNLQCLCVHCKRSKGNKTDNTKADLKHRKQTYGEYQRSVYLKQETKNTMNWIREDMKKRDDSDIKKLLGANEEELKPLMSWVKKEAKKRGIIK